MNYVKFRRGLIDDFNKLQVKESDTLYFVYDEDEAYAELWLGSKKITGESGNNTSNQSLSNLKDVIITEIQNDNLLIYENGKWINKSVEDVIKNYMNLSTVTAIIVENLNNNTHQDLLAQEENNKTPINGDIIVIKDIIDTNHYQHTGYVYSNSQWIALDGNYKADNVYFNNDFIFTENVGTITIPESGNITVSAKGKNLQDFLTSIFAQEKNPEVIYPAATLSVNGNSGEVGSSYTLPIATLSVTDGSYSYGAKENNALHDAENTGVIFDIGDVTLTEGNNTVTNNVILTDGNIVLTASQKNNDLIYTDEDQSYTFSASAIYTPSKTRIPITNLGNINQECQIGYNKETHQIDDKVEVEFTNSKTIKMTGWRKMFMGTVSEYNNLTHIKENVTIDSTLIRNLKLVNEKVGTSAKEFTVPVGTTKIIVACPQEYILKKCEYFTMSWETIANFPSFGTVAVADARGENQGLKDYNVYVFEHSSPTGFETDTKYKITLSKA